MPAPRATHCFSSLISRSNHQPPVAGPGPAGTLSSFLSDPVTLAILRLPEERLNAYLANDAYKPRMHK